MSTIKTNTLTGTTSAGVINVTGEGGSTTTNLQQGLCKIHCNLNGSGTIAFRDSFNLGTTTDNGTGDYTFNFTNNMANANYNCAPSSASGYSDVSAINRNVKVESATTAPSSSLVRVQYGLNYFSASAVEDCPQLYMSIHGDLA
tara:strand:+ start:385 stop:816 length:432 start_codon:yes stop_codon:yes gene_type:complete